MKDFLKRFIIVIIFLLGVMAALILANLYMQNKENKPTENKVEEQQALPGAIPVCGVDRLYLSGDPDDHDCQAWHVARHRPDPV